MGERISDTLIRVPRRAESEDGKTIGDSFQDIGPEHPDYAAWDEYLNRRESQI